MRAFRSTLSLIKRDPRENSLLVSSSALLQAMDTNVTVKAIPRANVTKYVNQRGVLTASGFLEDIILAYGTYSNTISSLDR